MRFSCHTSERTGFTLIEMVVAISISVVLLLAIVNLFFSFQTIYGYEQAFMATAGSAGSALNALEASVLPAERVLASRDFSGTIYTSATTTLVLELPAFDSSGDIIADVKDYVVFYASSTELYRRVEADVQSERNSGLTRLSTVLDSLSFTYDNSDITKTTNVIADIQTTVQYKQQAVQSHLREQLYLRNAQPLP